MSGITNFPIAVMVATLLVAFALPASAQSVDADSPASSSPLALGDSEYAQDAAALMPLTAGDKRHAKANLRTMFRRVEREWPRLLLRYAQPAVRGLLADRQMGSNTFSLKTTLFRDNTKGLHLAGGLGRNSWGEREARLQFSARF